MHEDLYANYANYTLIDSINNKKLYLQSEIGGIRDVEKNALIDGAITLTTGADEWRSGPAGNGFTLDSAIKKVAMFGFCDQMMLRVDFLVCFERKGSKITGIFSRKDISTKNHRQIATPFFL